MENKIKTCASQGSNCDQAKVKTEHYNRTTRWFVTVLSTKNVLMLRQVGDVKNSTMICISLFNSELKFVIGITLSYELQSWWFFFLNFSKIMFFRVIEFFVSQL